MKSPNRDLRKPACIFGALGDETRLRLVARLSGSEPLSITQLAAGTGLTRQGITKHLHVLANAKLIRPRKEGREQQWSLNTARIEEARKMLDNIGRAWDDKLSRLKALAEGDL